MEIKLLKIAKEQPEQMEIRCHEVTEEIKEIADQMLKLVLEVAPNLFKNAGPACANGACSEGKMTCGKAKEIREFYKGLKVNG